MEFTLKRIAYAKYDDFIEKVLESTPNIDLAFFKQLDDMTEDVLVGGKNIILNIDVDELESIIDKVYTDNDQNPMQSIDVKFSELLYRQLYLDEFVPNYLLYEKEVWAYINCFILFDVVKKRYFAEEGDLNNKKRIENVMLCNNSTIDRTGLRWLWALSNSAYSPSYGFRLVDTAYKFIDPVKALFERTLGSNKILFKAFIRSIEILNFDSRIKSGKFRSILLTHIRNLATMKMYESVDSVEELAQIFASDIRDFIESFE